MKIERRGMMRGYKKLRVWQDAKAFYVLTWEVFKEFPYELTRIRSQQVASSDSVHRNIAEGYCRRSLKEYIQFLNIALGSLGESASALDVYVDAGHISEAQLEKMDTLAWKLENGLKKLVESLQEKTGKEWSDSFVLKESTELYTTAEDAEGQSLPPPIQPSSNPTIQSP